MNSKMFFGYDKFFKSIYDNSIIKFVEGGKTKIGHLWYNGQWNEWIISYHHLYSEWGFSIKGRKIKSLRLIGDGDKNEHFLKLYRDQ